MAAALRAPDSPVQAVLDAVSHSISIDQPGAIGFGSQECLEAAPAITARDSVEFWTANFLRCYDW
jgi:hypothetical protein